MNDIRNVAIAQELVPILLNKDDSWENWRSSPYTGKIFSTNNSNEFESENIYVQVTQKSKILAIGKYEDRHYTDEDKYYSSYYYFFSYGNVEDDNISSLITVKEKEYTKSIDLQDLYLKASISNMGINLDDINSSFF